MLVPKGPIVSVVDKNGNKYEETSSLEKVKYPLAVLVDHGSASAAEIVAVRLRIQKAVSFSVQKPSVKAVCNRYTAWTAIRQ